MIYIFIESISLEHFITSHIGIPRCTYIIYENRCRFDHINNPQHDAYLRMQQYNRANARTPSSSQGAESPANINRTTPTQTSTPAAGGWEVGGGGITLG